MASPVPHPGPLGPLWLFFNPIGRVSREPYWLAFALVWAIFAILITVGLRDMDLSGVNLDEPQSLEMAVAAFVESNPLVPYALMLFQWVELALVIKRLQDRGLTGFLAIAVFIPGINIAFIVGLGLIPGTPGPNAYGPGPNSRWKRPT
ncbi:DUF805 domain-containing protein [Stappia sp.]|uniref:DUF805 domain-containing protein n=1 Tax=Stappia sp. TaxID=1870903 RepID=UPI0032D8C80C